MFANWGPPCRVLVENADSLVSALDGVLGEAMVKRIAWETVEFGWVAWYNFICCHFGDSWWYPAKKIASWGILDFNELCLGANA